MANATARVQMTSTPIPDSKRKWELVGSLSTTYYPGCMMGVAATGYAQKLDDTAKLTFIGINAETTDIIGESTDSSGDRKINVDRPGLFQMTISSAAITDVGKKVYALYDNEVSYSDGTYGNYVGRVFSYIDSTTVLVAPPWSPFHDVACGYNSVFSANAAAGTTLTRMDLNKIILVPNTAAVTITLPAVALCSPGDRLTFIKTTSDAFAFTLDGNASETINGATTLASGASQYETLTIVTDGAAWYTLGAGGATTFTGDVTVANGYGILVGDPTQRTISDGDGATNLIPEVQILGTAKADSSLLLGCWNTTDNATVAPSLNFLKSGNGTIGSNTIVAANEILGEITFFGDDGVDYESPACQLQGIALATPGVGDMPGALLVRCTTDGGETLAEVGRFTSALGLQLGVAGTKLGQLNMCGNTSGVVTIQTAAAAGTWTLTLPPDDGDAGEQLQTNGSGVTTWEAAGSMRAVKNVIAEVSNRAMDALDKIKQVGVYAFQYLEGARPTTGDRETVYTGVMADELPEVMHHNGRIFSPVSAFGLSCLAIKALADRVERLEAAVA